MNTIPDNPLTRQALAHLPPEQIERIARWASAAPTRQARLFDDLDWRPDQQPLFAINPPEEPDA